MIPIFLINLDKAAGRLISATEVLKSIGLSFERISAVDGALINPEVLPRFDRADAVRAIGRPLSFGEVGCFQSHVECARVIVERNLPYAIVLEDDVQPEPHAAEDLAALEAWLADAPDFTLMHLGAASSKFHRVLFRLPSGRKVLRSYYYPIRTHAILWSRAGAERFLQSYRFNMEIDQSLKYWLCGSGHGLTVKSAIFGWNDDESQIEVDRSKLFSSYGNYMPSLHRKRRWRNYGYALAGYLLHSARSPANELLLKESDE